jgi:hypothetical protein
MTLYEFNLLDLADYYLHTLITHYQVFKEV